MAGLLAAATETVMATWTKLNNDNEYEFLPARRSASAVFATATSCPSVCHSRCCIETDKDIIKVTHQARVMKNTDNKLQIRKTSVEK